MRLGNATAKRRHSVRPSFDDGGEDRVRRTAIDPLIVHQRRPDASTALRVAALGQTLKDLTQAAADATQTKRQLGTLKALADTVTQKVSALEQQREIVERTTSQVAHLHDLMREVDAKTRKHEESAKALGELESKVSELSALGAVWRGRASN